MQRSRFTLVVPYGDERGHYLVYNTRTQALLAVNQELHDALMALPDESRFAAGNRSLLSALHANGIVVQDDTEEQRLLDDYYDQIENKKNRMSFEATILTTLECNFACPYCFEQGAKAPRSLTRTNAEQVMTWLKNMVVREGYTNLHVTFYGGEPLLNKKMITVIAAHMKQWCHDRHVGFNFSMYTNGYLINPADIDAWIALGLKHIQITVDGDRSTHDSRRTLHNGEGTFDCIMANIQAIIDKPVNVSLSGNYERGQSDGMIRLLDYLDDIGLLRKLDSLGFTPILPRFGATASSASMELTECFTYYDTDFLDAHWRIRSEMMRRGLTIPLGMGYIACMLISRHDGVVIDPDGFLFKCPTMVGYPEFSVGHVGTDGYNDKNEEFLSLRAWQHCDQSCPYLPVCNGGCRFMAYAKHGSFEKPWCVKHNIDQMAPDLIRYDYERMVQS